MNNIFNIVAWSINLKQHFLQLCESPGQCRLAKSSLFFNTGVRRGFRAGSQDLSQISLLRRLENVLRLSSLYYLKRKTAGGFLHKLIGERIRMRLIPWSCLSVVFRWWPRLLLSRKVPSVLNLTMAYCTAVLECRNLAPLTRAVILHHVESLFAPLQPLSKKTFCPYQGWRQNWKKHLIDTDNSVYITCKY